MIGEPWTYLEYQSQVLSKHVYIEEQLKMKPESETRARSSKHGNGTKERVLIRTPEETWSYVWQWAVGYPLANSAPKHFCFIVAYICLSISPFKAPVHFPSHCYKVNNHILTEAGSKTVNSGARTASFELRTHWAFKESKNKNREMQIPEIRV